MDAYRALNPSGRVPTHENGGRIDKARVSATLLRGLGSIAETSHLPPSHAQIAYEKGKKPLLKKSDHHVVRLVHRVSDTPTKKGFTFASEMLQQPEGADALRGEMRRIVRATAQAGDAGDAQQLLAAAWRQCSDKLRSTQWDALQREYRNKHSKTTRLQQEVRANLGKPAERRYREEVARAKRGEAAALLRIQRTQHARRGATQDRLLAEEASEVSKWMKPKKRAEPVTELYSKSTGKNEHTTEGIMRAMTEEWEPVFQMPWEGTPDVEKEMQEELDEVEREVAAHLPPWFRESLTMEAVLDPENIREALKSLKSHTTPGTDGIPLDVYQAFSDDDEMINHLIGLFREILENKRMPDDMRTATISMIYKNKGSRADPAMYRPIAVTQATYRILGRAMAQRLARVMHFLVGDSQTGFQLFRHVGENVRLISEILRYCEFDAPDEGGALLILDNSKAYDRVQWPFMHRVLRAFGLPDCFCAMVDAMYTDVSVRLRINGALGAPIQVKSGVRQGCCLSSLVFLLVQEVLLRMVRRDERVRGIQIPGADGSTDAGHTVEVKERGLADDVAILLANPEEGCAHLRTIFERYKRMSGQQLNIGKSEMVFFGDKSSLAAHDGDGSPRDPQRTCWPGMRVSNSVSIKEKYHGIRIAPPHEVAEQWAQDAARMKERIAEEEERYSRFSSAGRQSVARSRYASKVFYPWQFQVPAKKDRERIVKEVQKSLKRVWAWTGVKDDLARQPQAEFGLGALDLGTHLRSMWASCIRDVLEPAARPWKNFVAYALRKVYGPELASGKELLTSNYSFAAVESQPVNSITESMRCALTAWGSLPRWRPAYAEGNARVAIAPGRQDEVVFRALRHEEDPRKGLKAPGFRRKGMETVTEALQKGSSMASHGISTTRSILTAYAYSEMRKLAPVVADTRVETGPDGRARVRLEVSPTTRANTPARKYAVAPGHLIVAIRAAAVEGERYDVSTTAPMLRAGVKDGTFAAKVAKKHNEIMFTGTEGAFIPPAAIIGVFDMN